MESKQDAGSGRGASGKRVPEADECGQGAQRFIADLHLTDDGDNPLVPAFCEWLARQPVEEGLWILGDLFEYWLGPPHLESEGFAEVFAALKKRSEAGGFTGVVPGNRDFLLGRPFEQKTGATLFPNGARIAREGPAWLILHGDELCTEDKGYQRLRKVLRSRPFGWGLRVLPTFARRRLARRLRSASKSSVPRKDPAQIAMQPGEARARMESAGATRLLCGHAHEYAESNPAPGQTWFVIDAFGHGAHDVMRLGPDGGSTFSNSGAGTLLRA